MDKEAFAKEFFTLFKDIKQFSVEQMPLFCQEYVSYVKIESLVAIIGFSILAIIFTSIFICTFISFNKDELEEKIVSSAVYSGAMIIPIFGGIDFGLMYIKCHIAPKVVILDYVQGFF